MTKYLLKRLIRGLISVAIVVIIVMALVYTFIDRDFIFNGDTQIQKQQHNDKEVYKYTQWERYGYLENLTYAEFLTSLEEKGEISSENRAEAVKIGRTASSDSEITKVYVQKILRIL